ncbi:MAG: NAD-dependent succinate-semialdehyde dehydrogenase [Burkholderiaceae bacterium]
MSKISYPAVQQFIDKQWIDGSGEASAEVLDPATEQLLSRFCHASEADVARALAATADGFERWSAMTALARARLLHAAADWLRAHAADHAAWTTQEQGKPLPESQGEIMMAAEMFDWFAEEGRRLYGRIIPSRWPGLRQSVLREPTGPVALLTPWNAPVMIPAFKLGAALAAGCSAILKPSEETPASAMLLVRALQEAGIPDGVVGLLLGDPARITQQLVASQQIAKVSFTGSTAVGRLIGELCGRHLKKVTLELGGHAAAIVCADADPAQAARTLGQLKFRNAGQICASPSRMLVHETIYEPFVAELAKVAAGQSVGDGREAGTTMGPMANRRRVQALQRLVDDAIEQGAARVAPEARVPAQGFYFAPVVLRDVSDRCRVMNEEPFGPIAPCDRFSSLDEAVQRANRLPYGLAAYVFTRDSQTEAQLVRRLHAGSVGVNNTMLMQPETPFGGFGDSGYGKDNGAEGILEYTREKFVSSGFMG